MKITRRRLLFLGVLLLLGPSWAHPGQGPHTHEIEVDGEEAKLLAKDAVIAKIKEKKLPANWAKCEPSGVEAKKFGSAVEWLVTFDNPAISEPKKSRLYVFIKLNGQLSAINYTGR